MKPTEQCRHQERDDKRVLIEAVVRAKGGRVLRKRGVTINPQGLPKPP
jgi:hypothetical protein